MVEEIEVVLTMPEDLAAAAEAGFRQHLENVAARAADLLEGRRELYRRMQGVAGLAPQASSADAPAPDVQDECATTDDPQTCQPTPPASASR